MSVHSVGKDGIGIEDAGFVSLGAGTFHRVRACVSACVRARVNENASRKCLITAVLKCPEG